MFFENLPEGSEPIATARVKWDVAYQSRVGIDTGPAKELAPELGAEITRIAKRTYKALGLSGYARIDLRLDEAGKLYVIEANPNPDLTKAEDFARSAATGLEYNALLQHPEPRHEVRSPWKAAGKVDVPLPARCGQRVETRAMRGQQPMRQASMVARRRPRGVDPRPPDSAAAKPCPGRCAR
jgi:hypothetical protein